MSRPSKRARKSVPVSYHDPVPLDDEYGLIYAREDRNRQFGDISRTAPSSRLPELASDSWLTRNAWTPPDDPSFGLDPDGEWYDVTVEAHVMDEGTQTSFEKKKTKSKISKRPHVAWMNTHRQNYLEELTLWSGRSDFRSAKDCPDCLARGVNDGAQPEYRCHECFQPDLACLSCCLRRHRVHPLHRIEKWTGVAFVKVSLKSIGLKIQLNHGSMYCSNPIPCHTSMLVLHTNGIHEVAIQYCGCTRLLPQHIQLLRRRLYPASQVVVKTCATFELLRMLHMLALTTKASTYDFYRTLEKLTINTGIDCPKSRYRALMRMILQWRHLKMLKWGGRVNVDDGVRTTQPGDLAIRFLYMVILCMDANFRLKNNLVSNFSQDPGLANGWAYMLPRVPYEAYVLSRANDEDISTCVGFQALSKANTKNSVGMRYTGVGMVSCGRSEMIMPTGAGNLHKGERYANMDYIFACALQFVLVALVTISYDIACQWFVNLFKRIDSHWPDHIKPPPSTSLIPAIPKLHEPMHQTKDHQVFSFNFLPGVGLTNGEAPERIWHPHNALGNSTKTQGPGSRMDVLDDHFGFWNWLKYHGQGATLLRRYKAAVVARNLQAEAHRGLTEALAATLVETWEEMCRVWEKDDFPKKRPNPYNSEGATISEAQVKKDMAAEEAERLKSGGIALHVTSASGFLVMGLDIEDVQRRLRRLAKKTTPQATARQEGSLTEQRNILRTRIRNFEQLAPIYMPGLLQHRTDLASRPIPIASSISDNPEDNELWFPSRVAPSSRPRVCREGLTEIEDKLRTAQCEDALEAVRHILKIKTRMIAFKNRNIRGQRQGTRSRAVIDRVHERARMAAEKYRAARAAKLKLVGPGMWEETLRVLADEDIRGYQDANQLRPRQQRPGILEDDQLEVDETPPVPDVDPNAPDTLLFNAARTRRNGTGETRRTLSWIWRTMRHSDTVGAEDDILRVEWAKSRARAARANEEVLLLKEEMRRVLETLKWRAAWWRDRASLREDISSGLGEAITALSTSQAVVQDRLAAHFRKLWRAPLEDEAEVVDAPMLAEDADADDDDEEDDDEDGIEGQVGMVNADEEDDDGTAPS